MDTESLSTLESALMIAGLLEYFDTVPLGVTVLGPDNDAFAKLQESDPTFYAAVLRKPWILHLQNLLLTHVIAETKAADVVDGALYETAAVGAITAPIEATVGDKVCFNPALSDDGGCVTAADVMASNGVAHVRIFCAAVSQRKTRLTLVSCLDH